MFQVFYLSSAVCCKCFKSRSGMAYVAMTPMAGHHLPLVRELPDQWHDPVMGHQKLLRPASQDDVVEGNGGAAFRDDVVGGYGGAGAGGEGAVGSCEMEQQVPASGCGRPSGGLSASHIRI